MTQSTPAAVSQQARASGPRGARSEDETQRARVYSLMAALLASPPRAELLRRLREIGGAVVDDAGRATDTALASAWTELKAAAENAGEVALDDEFHDLFIGIGRGELMPYASWYLTGFLMERPLAQLRQDLRMLGFERKPGICEPEDHAAALCEIMSMMISGGEEISFAQQRAFFDNYAAWMGPFFIDLRKAKSARFYRAVGRFGEQFIMFEKEYLTMTV